MNRTAINNYAVWARREMVSRVSQRAAKYGITEEHIGSTTEDSVNGVLLSRIELRERNALIGEIQKKGYREVMDEVAYTWFNRFTALRFMEVNGYIPTLVRVFTDENNNFRPQILTEAINLEMDGLNLDKVYEYKNRNDNEGLFKYLIITQCNALSTPLPMMFQKISDYTELLFPDNLLREGSVIQKMIEMIPEDDWKDQVEIIGWLYQYYNTELNEQIYDGNMSKVRVSKEMLPAATTIYTPDWIAHYMVENSLGRIWLEGHTNDELKLKWKYYLEEVEQKPEVKKKLHEIKNEYSRMNPQDIRVIDPCMGSGHILIVMFDILVQIYESQGYTSREAASMIVKYNLWGFDIDDRATQLAYFAVMMKARYYDRRFFSRGIQPHVYSIAESNDIDNFTIDYFANGNDKLKKDFATIVDELYDAKEYGSIINVTPVDFSAIRSRLTEIEKSDDMYKDNIMKAIRPIIPVAEALAQKYDVVCTNPPYLGYSRFSTKLTNYTVKNYPEEKADLSMVMYKHALQDMCKNNGFVAFITTNSWAFLKSFEELRKYVLSNYDFISFVDCGTELFEGKVGHNPIVTWVNRKSHTDYLMTGIRLVDYCFSRRNEKELEFFNKSNRNYPKQSNFAKIPGSPIAYNVSKEMFDLFDAADPVISRLKPYQGLATGDNGKFLRFWHEVSINNECFNASSAEIARHTGKRWFPYNKGGDYRKWFGNEDNMVNWFNDGEEIRHFTDENGKQRSVIRSPQTYFNPCISWSKISSGVMAFRYKNEGFVYDVAGPSIFGDSKDLKYALGFFNSNVAMSIAAFMSPTINYEVGQIANYPLVVDEDNVESVNSIVEKNISLAKEDWDSFETSWNFKRSPLLPPLTEPTYEEQVEMDAGTFKVMKYLGDLANEVFYVNSLKCPSLEGAYRKYKDQANEDFYHLKMNEEELNRIFIEIYGLQDELKPEEDEKMVSIHRIYDSEDEIPEGMKKSQYALTKKDVVKEFISYAVGCMFGRYSLDSEGLAYAGGEWDSSKYVTYPADKDNIIPVCDDDYFDDDILTRFVNFVKVTFGAESLEDNLKFIADALGGKGTPREIIRSYFINGFYVDHLKTYQKRPIYWLFDSGKKNGFKALIYMHRYQSDTVARVRTDYVHEIQNRYRAALDEIEKKKTNVSSTSEKVKLEKNEAVLKAKAEEVRVYEEKIHHLADQMISIDLDDGVKVNYAKFQDVLATIK